MQLHCHHINVVQLQRWNYYVYILSVDVGCPLQCMRSMKKRSASDLLIWVMVITLHAYLSIAAVSNPNETMSLCDASLQDCPILYQFDSQFPSITVTMLSKGSSLTDNSRNRYRQVIPPCTNKYGYRFCSPLSKRPNGVKTRPYCRSERQRDCPGSG